MSQKIASTLRGGEVKLLDELAVKPHGRAGVIRAMLRFALEHMPEFWAWMATTDGRPTDEREVDYPTLRPDSHFVDQPPPEPWLHLSDVIVVDDAFNNAMRPLLGLAGTTPEAIYAGGFELTKDNLKFNSVLPVIGVTPIQLSGGEDDHHAVWAWPVNITITTDKETTS